MHLKNIRMISLRMPTDEFCRNDVESFIIHKDILEGMNVKLGNIIQKFHFIQH